MTPGLFDRLRRATVQLVATWPSGRVRWAGSGVIVSVRPDRSRAIVVTAAHVLDSIHEEVLAGASARAYRFGHFAVVDGALELDVISDRIGRTATHSEWHQDAASAATDVALVELLGEGFDPRLTVALSSQPLARGAEVAMVGYGSLGPIVTVGWFQEYGEDGTVRCLMHCREGQSGGPLLDLSTGQLVGIASREAQSQAQGSAAGDPIVVRSATSILAPASAIEAVAREHAERLVAE